MLRGRVSLMPFINWGQVISVTAENVLGADNVTLTFLERKVQKTKSQKISQEEERGKKGNCFSTALFKNENQSAGSRSHSRPHRDVMNINISVYKCVFLLKSNALSESFSFFFTQTSLNVTTRASAVQPNTLSSTLITALKRNQQQI